jgi:hypothetical protein
MAGPAISVRISRFEAYPMRDKNRRPASWQYATAYYSMIGLVWYDISVKEWDWYEWPLWKIWFPAMLLLWLYLIILGLFSLIMVFKGRPYKARRSFPGKIVIFQFAVMYRSEKRESGGLQRVVPITEIANAAASMCSMIQSISTAT